jgi:1-deoxy-D-xylulose-5-phosphate reductoisomerase
MTTTVALAGCTGSIGTQTLDVVRAEPDRFRVVALGASGRNPEAVAAQAVEVGAAVVAIDDESGAAALKELLPASCELRAGAGALASLEAGKRLALANKESLIAAGPVVQQARRTPGAELIPVDSEHGALHQCLRSGGYVDARVPRRVGRLLLTASGGPFRGRTRAELEAVTVDDALAHPTWSMGPKITVDSSTLMNKGLEVIEANELFGEPAGEAGVGISLDQIDVVVHPQSIVHSMVEYTDASTIAQLSLPDMRLPIGYALAWPDRLGTPFGHIDWANLGRLDFEPPDLATFGCLSLAFEAARIGGTAPAWLNAANEVVVAAFLAGRVPWIAISEVLSEALTRHDGSSASSVEAVVDVDRRARLDTNELLARWDRR